MDQGKRGNLEDLSPYGTRSRKMCAGRLLALVMPGKTGPAKVTFESEGIEGCSVDIFVR